jgi:hypothetical protein
VVDSWLSLPYPEWYMDYFLGHLEPSRHPLAFLGAFAAATTDAAAGDPAAAPVQEVCELSSQSPNAPLVSSITAKAAAGMQIRCTCRSLHHFLQAS